MKISNSKKELAHIISENGGWRDGNYAVQDRYDKKVWFMRALAGRPDGASFWPGVKSRGIPYSKVLTNWHQTALSRAEYFHLYPVQDDDGWIEWKGGECPVEVGTIVDVKQRDGDFGTYLHAGKKTFELQSEGVATAEDWSHLDEGGDIIAYRLHKPEQAKLEFCESVVRSIPEPEINSKNINITQVDDINVVESKPTIEQLAADYRTAKDHADRKQQEADDAKADADANLKALELAGEALGLLVSPITAKKEPELVITDWRDLQVGDIIQCVGSWEKEKTDGMQLQVTALEGPNYNGDLPIRVEVPGISCPSTWGINFKFIRRP